MRVALATVVLAAAAAPAAAHIALTSPTTRTQMQKDGPCGLPGSTRGTAITTLAAGQTITVEWDETVDHPGHFRIAFDDDGNDFPNPVRSTDAFPTTLVDNIADHVGGHYTQDITLPDLECTNCTLQLIQVMTTSEPYLEGNLYFQCADLTLTREAPGDDMPADDEPGGNSGGCAAGRGGGGFGAVLLAVLVLAARRRQGANSSAPRS